MWLKGCPASMVTESLNLRFRLWAGTLQPPVKRVCSGHRDLSSTHFSPDCCSYFCCQFRASSTLSVPTQLVLQNTHHRGNNGLDVLAILVRSWPLGGGGVFYGPPFPLCHLPVPFLDGVGQEDALGSELSLGQNRLSLVLSGEHRVMVGVVREIQNPGGGSSSLLNSKLTDQAIDSAHLGTRALTEVTCGRISCHPSKTGP